MDHPRAPERCVDSYTVLPDGKAWWYADEFKGEFPESSQYRTEPRFRARDQCVHLAPHDVWGNSRKVSMWPLLPEKASDLVPLPPIDGPKLKPFDFGNDDNIEFLSVLGRGLSGIVFKARIGVRIYALKLFMFQGFPTYDRALDYLDHSPDIAYNWLWQEECFSRECRAYGRLQEAGREHLAVKCHGYFLLKKEYEIILEQKFGLGPGTWGWCFDYDEGPHEEDLASRRDCAEADGNWRPIRVIVKEFIDGDEGIEPAYVKKMAQNLLDLHALGVIQNDIKEDAYIDGVLVDFSEAYTTPHPRLNAELSHIYSEQNAFDLCDADIDKFWDMVHRWNRKNGETRGMLCNRDLGKGYYGHGMTLRCHKEPGRRKYGIPADPRRYNWRSGSKKRIRRHAWMFRDNKFRLNYKVPPKSHPPLPWE